MIQAVIWLKGGPCREPMHEKSVSHTRIQNLCVCVGGGGWGVDSRPACLKTTLTIFLVLNFNILHLTVIERGSWIRACPHSSERLIPGGKVLMYMYTYEKSQCPLCQQVGVSPPSKMRVPAPKLGVRTANQQLVRALTMLCSCTSLLVRSPWERIGSVVECLNRDWGAAGSNLTGVTALCPWARTLILAKHWFNTGRPVRALVNILT